jgi:GTP-binding protein HflX
MPSGEGAALAWLHEHGEVAESRMSDDRLDLIVRLDPEDLGRFVKRFGRVARIEGERTALPQAAE